MQSKNLIYRMKKKIESNGGHDSIAFKELGENGDEIATLTYNELHYRALHYAEKIKLKTKKNDRVILLYSAQLDFIVAFIACLYAKVIAVPVNPPSRNQKIHRLTSILEDANPALILTTKKIKLSARNSGIVDKYSKLEWLCLSEINPPGLISARSNITLDVDIDSSDVAFLQYTSGSSGNPKGVVITHKNLVCNLDMIRRAYDVGEKTIIVSWLPMFHDMGLIGMVLQTIYSCCECIVIPPSVFLRTPDIWLRTISKYKATISGAPNFGFEHCNRRIKKEKLESIDLSSWKIAYCGAEPIRRDVIETFSINFEKFGFNPKALFSCYGMAEATLCVTASPILRGIIFDKPEIDKTELSEHFEFIASCGSPKDDTEIQIVDPKSKHRCKDRQVGEIWLRGNSISTKYWNKPGKTKKSFQARIKGDKNKFYYRTGDLGYLKDNELYVTGRLSDLIIIRGVNYYPQDIEVLVASSSEWLVKGGGVAFSVEVEGQEKLVLLQELDRTVVRKKSSYYEKLRNDIQKDLYENFGIRADTIIFLKPGKVFRTSSGKVQRKKSRKVYLENNLEGIVDRGPIDVGTSVNSEKSTSNELEYIRKILKEQVAEIIKCNIDAIDIFQPFHNYGMDSVAAAEIAQVIGEKFQISLPITAVFDYPDISSISKHICECVKNNSESVVGEMHSTSVSANTTSKTPKNLYTNNNDIAVIGMAAALPGANTLQEFWENLLHGRDCIEIVPPGRWNQDILYEQISEQECPSWGGFIDNPYLFDPHFFNISPSEAELMDPQQRLFLQNAWHAFEDAGYTLENLYNLNCGVFVGCSINDYHRLIEQISTPTSAYTMMGNSHAILASRIAYFLNLKGVCTTLDTACSSSLLAVHMACEFLRRGELSISIAGGVNVLNTPQFHLFANKAGMLSSVGRCQTFSEAADGLVPAEGVANVILKPLKSAEKDGDRIYAVIKASNSNQDGHTNGITAPNGLSQTELQEKTYERFGINPRNIAYVEAHGTGTSLGDPIEVDALTRSFRRYTTDKHFCAIGSIKSNIGHTLATAGIAGLIKAILCVKEACLPASLHQNALNKRINFADSPFYTLSKNLDWPSQFTSRMAAVNSFGYSGTNVHIVLENYDNKKLDSPGVGFQLCVLSAKSETSLKSGIYNLNRMLSQENNNFLLYSLCHTLALHKNHFEKRTAFVTHSIEDLKSQLHSYLEGKTEVSRELLGNEEMEVLLRKLFSSDRQIHLQKLANHYCAGGDVVWNKVFTAKPNRVAVPLYAFDRDEYKIGNSVNLSNDQNNVDVNKNLEVGNNNIKLKNFSIKKSQNILTKNNDHDHDHDHDHEIKKMLNKDIMYAVSEVLKINIEKINLKNDIRNYGFDSINIVDLSNLLNKKYQISILPPQLFEFNTLENFSNFLMSSYGGAIHEYYDSSTETLRKCKNNENKIKTSLESINLKDTIEQNAEYFPKVNQEPIAIVGYAGMMPGSKNLEHFWQRLMEGDNLVCEIPKNRWDWQAYYGEARKKIGCTEVNRGGFMLQVDQFDAKFFGMSHREANLTDPQQRLFLQNVWHAIEHAGYNPECLAGSLTGVFCGIFTADYTELLIDSGYIKEAHAITGLAHSILPNRVSYLLDLRGPSVPIDTACSSSLVALHQAIDSIRQGSCNMAIVGGVNVMASATPYLSASRAGMISDACKTFDKRADGYARGEGVGAILIKPLSQALTDRDSVHAVIRGSAVNHGGAANSLTSPNPEAQADVIRDAMQRSGISPHRINYIEAHGTGTSLGDPIEINGLKKAFQDLYKKSGIQLPRNHCRLGTVKSSIGHLEAAAGIAGLLKVILSLKHKKLHGNIHLQEINPYIDLEESPFYLIKENQDWEPLRDENGKVMPRCAGISSFGFGGTNSHIVIEEWNVEDRYERDDALKQEELITLSAKSEEQLKKTVQQLCQYLQNCECQPILPNIAFTLQSGRKHWPYRLAISCVTVEDLVNKLQKVSSGLLPEGVWEGYVDINKESSSEVLNKMDIPQHDNLEGLANLWLNNANVDWDMFRDNSRVRRVPLPTYIFDNKSHWIPNDNSFSDTSVKNSVLINNKYTSSNSDSINHFLLGSVRREVNQIIPLDKLNSEEYYFSDHQVSGHAILPAAFVIEIMRSAVSMATGKNVTFIEELCLINPISPNDTRSKLRLNLQSDNNDKILVTLESCLKSGVILKHSKALVNVKSDHKTKDLKVSLKTISDSCEKAFKKDDIYQQLSRNGLNYGVSFQALTKLKSNEYKAVGHLKLPRVRRQDAENYVLSPSMLDASMHSIVGIINCRNPTLKAALIPYKCKKIIVHKKLPSQCIVYTRLRSERENNNIWKFDIDIADIEGNILVEIVQLELFEMLLGTKKVEVNKTAYSDLHYWNKIKRKQSLVSLDREEKGICLIFHAADKNNKTSLRFSNLTNDVEFIDIYPGKNYNKNSAKEYIISHQKIDNFEKLFLSLPDYPSYIIVESRHAIDEVKYLFEDGLRHLIYLIKAMANHRKNSRCQLLLLSETQKGLPIAFAQTGFLKSIRWECPWLSTKIVHTSNKNIGYAELWAELISSSEYVEEVFYDRGERFVSQVVSWKPDETDHSEPLLRNKGVYWITGGVGGIAKIIANYLVEHYQANLLLTGRRAKDDDIENYLKVIERNGGKAIYVSADVNNFTSLEIALDQCRRYFGSLTGIFHSAGLLRDGTLSNKSLEDFNSVITPKINGIVNIDNVTSNEPLDIFVAFSSIVGVTGNIGQSDYASGNAFMDEYIRLRKDNNSRPGRSLSINWPLWEHGGMNIPENVKNIVYKRTGMLSLDTDSGLAALVTALKNNMEQIIVTKGDQKQIAKFINASHMEDQIHEDSVTKENILLNIDNVIEIKKDTEVAKKNINIEKLIIKTEKYLIDKFSSAVGESAFDIDVNTPFQELGVDSFIVIQLLSDLENIFGELPKTLLFEKHCISELSRYFVEEHYDTLCDMFSINDVEVLVEKVSLEATEKESVIETVSKNATYYSNTTDVEPLPVQELINNDSGENFRRKTEEYLLKILSEATGALRIEVNTHFQDLEVDSFIALKIINDLGKLFGELPKTLLFENYCVSDLATYFIKEHKETLAGILSKFKNKKVNISEDTTTTYGIEKNDIFNHNKYSEYVQETVLTPKVVGECFQETQIFLQDETTIEAVNELNDKYGAESTALGRANFAPHIFIGSSLTGFFYCNEKDQYLVAFGYIGPDHSLSININEIENYAKSKNKDLYFIDQENVLNLREKEYLTLPFAVLQRIENIRGFTTNGKSKRKLRYMISKFKQSGKTLTEEYSVGSDQRIDNYIIEIIDSWSEQKVMVNPYIKRVKSNIKNKQLSPNYRVFLTWCDNNLENVIIISSMKSHNGYLMDCEFYTNDMIKGGLEFAIVSIIEILREEGCDMFSLGITWGAKVEDKGNPDIKSRKTLLELMERNIFDGSGNLQFKNKFQPNNKQIYLLKPKSLAKDRVLDIILTIANSDHPSSDSGGGLEKSLDIQKTKAEASISLRKAQLEAAGYNPANIPAADVEKDLSTDSWAKLDYSWAQSPQPLKDVSLERLEGTIRRLLPFAFFTFTHSGDEAERCFWSSLQFAGKRVLQNRMFPTFIYNTLKAGYKPEEISSCNSENQSLIDLQKLQIELEQDFSNIAAVCVELATNANGGQVVPVAHLRQLKKLLSQHPGIPLIIDATRLLDNCIMQTANTDEYLSIVHETCSFADVLTISLSKNFMVSLGGVVACSNYSLAKRMDDYAKTNNLVLSGRDISSINIRLGQTEFLFENVRKRQEQTRCLQEAFDNAGVCFHKPASDWSVLIDVQSMDAFKTQPNSLASFLNDLYLHTGIRAGIHSPGLGPNPPFNGMLRVVIPVGMPDASVKKITQSITRLKDSNIPSGVLELASQPNEFGGHVKARYNYKENSKKTSTPSFSNIDSTVCKKAKENSTDIAIVGLSGRYPKANTMEEFWNNLKQGRDCVEEKSLTRWDERLPSDHSDIPQTRWGGFIDNVDKFDAMFFNIAPKEAALLDPQERLFMQIAWETLEDAGYTPESLVEKDPSRRVGVYVAAVWQLYQMLGAEQTEIGNLQTPNSLLWSIANRVSSFMNFSGPSMAVDTACSGSLASIYLACQAIQNGECSAAIAGGVNLDLHDSKWLLTRASGFLSPDGRCKAFAQGANGYVAGEGIGAILLKPLSQAIEDRDNIYGIIKACSFNHGGRASGYSVPNPNAQGEMIADAIAKSQIDARTINYIETHGTGTQLGDPIEIRGLTSAYSRYTSDLNFCALGSVKSNIGHLEAAAGIAGLTKVLLQMRYRTLVPSLHCEETNELIPFDNSPFYVQKKCAPWEPVSQDGKINPLRAGISSFGAGGANLHLIIEEAPYIKPLDENNKEYIIPISAYSVEQLQKYAKNIAKKLEHSNYSLRDVAYTLQIGRRAMQHRLAIVARSIKELIEVLVNYAEFAKINSDKSVFYANSRELKKAKTIFSDEDVCQLIKQWIDQKRMDKIAVAWTQGFIKDLAVVSGRKSGARISLPTYPFDMGYHWIKKDKTKTNRASTNHSLQQKKINGQELLLHPLIDKILSEHDIAHCIKRVDENQFYFRDHVVAGHSLLPGVAYIEMALAIYHQIIGRCPRQLRNLVWLAPINSSQYKIIDIYLKDNATLFEVTTGKKETIKVHAQGKVTQNPVISLPKNLNMQKLRTSFDRRTSNSECYAMLEKLQFGYGDCLRAIKDVEHNETEALTHLVLPSQLQNEFTNYFLHPSLLDGAVQSAIALFGNANESIAGLVPYVPFFVKSINIFNSLTSSCYAYIRLIRTEKDVDSIKKVNITIVDDQGRVLVDINEFVYKAFSIEEIKGMIEINPSNETHSRKVMEANAADTKITYEPIYITPDWE